MTSGETGRPVVVGVDGSRSALRAVAIGAAEAERLRARLRLVHVSYLAEELDEGDHERAMHTLLTKQRELLDAAAGVARQAGATDVETVQAHGTVAETLVEESEHAAMMVLGSRGFTGADRVLLGSVATAVASHAHAPVIVLPIEAQVSQDGPIVVGIDGSPFADAALAFGFELAADTGAELVAVHAWLGVDLAADWVPLPAVLDWDTIQADHHRVVAERLAGWQEKFPQVRVRRVVVKDRPAHALLDACSGARLLVVGSRGRSVLTWAMGLGLVTRTVLHHASCPVAVVRPEHPRPARRVRTRRGQE